MLRLILLGFLGAIITSFVILGSIFYFNNFTLDQTVRMLPLPTSSPHKNDPNYMCDTSKDCAQTTHRLQCGSEIVCANKNAQFSPPPFRKDVETCIQMIITPPEGSQCGCVKSYCEFYR